MTLSPLSSARLRQIHIQIHLSRRSHSREQIHVFQLRRPAGPAPTGSSYWSRWARSLTTNRLLSTPRERALLGPSAPCSLTPEHGSVTDASRAPVPRRIRTGTRNTRARRSTRRASSLRCARAQTPWTWLSRPPPNTVPPRRKSGGETYCTSTSVVEGGRSRTALERAARAMLWHAFAASPRRFWLMMSETSRVFESISLSYSTSM